MTKPIRKVRSSKLVQLKKEIDWIAGIPQDSIIEAPEIWGKVLESARKCQRLLNRREKKKMHMPPDGLTLNDYSLIAEREGMQLVHIQKGELIAEDDYINWLSHKASGSTAWVRVVMDSPLIGKPATTSAFRFRSVKC